MINKTDREELMLHIKIMLDELKEIATTTYMDMYRSLPTDKELEFFCMGVSLGVCLNDKDFMKEFMKNEKSNRKNS